MFLKQVMGQKLVAVTEDSQGKLHFHFPDFVVITNDAYVSPVIERLT
jgi:hypothetical protein